MSTVIPFASFPLTDGRVQHVSADLCEVPERPISANPGLKFCSTFCIYMYRLMYLTADRLAQLVERQIAVREVSDSSPRPYQLSGY